MINVGEVAAWRMCVGCGACAYVCPERRVRLVDILEEGIRPIVNSGECEDCEECLTVCPGREISLERLESKESYIHELLGDCGPVLETWEGYASDPAIRFHGSSGGLATALALYCLEKEGMHGILHGGASLERPWQNVTVLSQSREDLLSRTGSRYSPVSPCDGLDLIEHAPQSCGFIGKPCDIQALRKTQSLRPDLGKNLGVTIGIFCAGTPSTKGTLDLLDRLGVCSEEVSEIRYRGKGWPGLATVRLKGEDVASHEMTYRESWGFLQRYRPYRCYLCPDGTGEFADISCGDPWYRESGDGEPGYSLVLVRTKKGGRILHGAMETGYVQAERVDPNVVTESQKNLLSKRKAIWGRLLAMKVFLIPAPRFRGFHLLRNWTSSSTGEKIRSIFGTCRRIIQRRYFVPIRMPEADSEPEECSFKPV